MARHKCIGIRHTLTTLLPKAEIERLAHESGAVRRRRKVDASAMLWTVLLGFGTGGERTLAGLRRSYERVTGKSLVPSSFYDRFSTELARMFRAVLRELMTKLAASEVRYGGVLEGFRDVLVADATVVKLHRLLARRFPGTRKNSSPAAAKLHLVMSASGTGAHKVKVTGERANDHRTLQMGPWVEGRLLLRGTPVVGRDPECCRPRSRSVRIERACAIGCVHWEMSYWRERRHPAARASASVQNHRSPFEALMRVRS